MSEILLPKWSGLWFLPFCSSKWIRSCTLPQNEHFVERLETKLLMQYLRDRENRGMKLRSYPRKSVSLPKIRNVARTCQNVRTCQNMPEHFNQKCSQNMPERRRRVFLAEATSCATRNVVIKLCLLLRQTMGQCQKVTDYFPVVELTLQ